MALKDQVLPPSLKEFEGSLKSVGIDPEKDVDQLTFASYRKGKEGVKAVSYTHLDVYKRQVIP